MRSLRALDYAVYVLRNCRWGGQLIPHRIPYLEERRRFSRKNWETVALRLAFSLTPICLLFSLAQQHSQGQGLVAGGVHEVHGFDTVDIKTGNSYIQIPLASIPQRGQLKTFNFVLSANTSTWSSTSQCQPPPPGQQVGTCGHSYATTGNFGPWISTPDLFGYDAATVDLYDYGTASIRGLILSAIDGTGAHHRLWFDSSNPLQARTIDGSGYLMKFQPGSQPYNPFESTEGLPASDPTLFDSNGRHVTSTALNQFAIADIDGNTIAVNDSGWTDTVGRHILRPPDSGTDVSQCVAPPAGGFMPTAATSWTVPGYSQPFTFCFTTIHIHTNFWGNDGQNVTDPCDPTNSCTVADSWIETVQDATVLQSVKLPDGTSWKFAYDSAPANDPSTIAYGNLTRIVGPTGGAVSYCYNLEPIEATSEHIFTGHDVQVVALLPYITNRIETQSDTPIDCNQYPLSVPNWSYAINVNAVSAPGYQIAVTDPTGNDTVHVFPFQGTIHGRLDNPDVPNESDRFYFTGRFADENVIKHVAFHYTTQSLVDFPDNSGDPVSPNALPSGEDTTIDQVLVSSTSKRYESTFTPAAYSCQHDRSNPSNDSCQSAVAAAPISLGIVKASSVGGQTTTTQYKWEEADHVFLDANIMSAASSVTLSDATSSATTQYTYDDSNYVTSGLGRGHLTSITGVNDNGSDVTTYNHYGAYGMIDSSVDGKGATSISISLWDSQHLFPTQIDFTLGSEHFTYDPDTGHLLSHTDLNGAVTTNVYDGFGRLQSTQNPDTSGGYTTYNCYPDANTFVQYQAQSTAVSSPTSCGAALGDAIVSKTSLDGLGRMTEVITGTGSSAVAQSTQYDLLDRPNKQSNPYKVSDGPGFWTTSHYDALGRIFQIDHPDGSTSSNKFTGLTVIASDESGLKKEIVNDPLGRITQVLEPNSTTGDLTLNTTYGYNVEGLTDVWQYGTTGDTVRHRNFSYDSLGQLLTAYNPETGTICYGVWSGDNCVNGYDPNGNLRYKTDARGVVTTFSYDRLNRTIAKTYSDGTPSACYAYDTATNGVGRLGASWTQTGACPDPAILPSSGFITSRQVLAYDQLGRIQTEQQCINGPCAAADTHKIDTRYDLAGNVTYSSNGVSSQRSPQIGFTYTPDTAGRLSSVLSTWNDATHPDKLFDATAPTAYGPTGLLKADIGEWSATPAQPAVLDETFTYDNRLRIRSIAATASQGSGTPVNTTTTVTVSPSTFELGGASTVAIHVDCNLACGQADVTVDTIDIGNQAIDSSGNVSLSTNTFPDAARSIGPHTVIASYLGNSTFAASSASATYTVTSQSTSIDFSINPSEFTAVEAPQLLIHVNCNSACGSVAMDIDGHGWIPGMTLDGNGNIPGFYNLWAVYWPTPYLTAGTHTFTARYLGNSSFAPSSKDFTVTIDPVGSQQTSVGLSVNPSTFTSAEDAVASAHVGCNSACGLVVFTIDGDRWVVGNADGNGNATVDTYWWWSSDFSQGTHRITASYLGNATYGPASASQTITVSAVGTQPAPISITTNSGSTVSLSSGWDASIQFDGSNTNGFEEILVDGSPWYSKEIGQFAWNYIHIGSGDSAFFSSGTTHTLKVRFMGNAAYAPTDSNELTLTVTP